jgi:MerR family transcriptional regulator, mercuric resistance operon regulatory protein
MTNVTVKKDVSQCFEVIPDFAAFMDAEGQSLEFPLTISQLAKAAQTTVHTARNYVLEQLIPCREHSPGGFGLYDQCALNRLRFIRTARAAGLLILDIKPLIYAINDGKQQASEEAMRLLQTKIDKRKAYLNSLDSQLSELRQLA